MNIMLNFVPLKLGGGVQVGLDFVSHIGSLGAHHNWYLACTAGTPFETAKLPPNCQLAAVVPRSMPRRLIFESFYAQELLRKHGIDVVYTQFGPQWATKGVKNIVGCAYSNLFYPEIDFWAGNAVLKRLERKIFDYVRLQKLKRADVVIFETEDLCTRAIKQKALSTEQAKFVLPAVSHNIGKHHKGHITQKLSSHPASFKLCFITTYAKHKNLEQLVNTLFSLKTSHNITDIAFVLTLAKDNANFIELEKHAEQLGVQDNIINLGPIPYDECAEVYTNCNAAILLSTLESFSNNIAESWSTQKPLVISDKDWARSLCQDAALFVDIDDAESIADTLALLANDKDLQTKLSENGVRRLKEFPSSAGRFAQYLDIIEA